MDVKIIKGLLYLFLLIQLFSSCDEKHLFELVDPGESGILFNNQLLENDSINVLEFMNMYTGGGVAVGDVNNDGLPDLYFSGNMVSSRLYINKSTKNKIRFEDITEKAGVKTDYWATGVNMIDINQDGLLDIYVCVSGSNKSTTKKNKLYINQGLENGMPRFQEMAAEYGIDDSTYTTQAAFFDYDGDGDLDMFLVVNHAENFRANALNVPITYTKEYDIDRSPRLYRNLTVERLENDSLSAGKLFMDVSLDAGIKEVGYGLGVAISDINKDGWPDIYVTCDFLTNDILYLNNQDGTFTNKIADYFTYTSYAGMGVDIADINNNGYTDIVVVDMTPEENVRLKSMRQKPNNFRLLNETKKGYYPQFSQNTLQLNNGDNLHGGISFSEISRLAGIHHTDWSWSALLADFDNDGFKDFFAANGFRRDMQDLDFINYVIHNKDDKELLKKIHSLPGVKIKNYIYRNNGMLQFENKTDDWGLTQHSYSNGAAYADLDNDGDLDLVVNNIDDMAFVYKNTSSESDNSHHYVKIHFTGPRHNRNGIGARVEIYTEDNFQLYENYPTRGFQSGLNTSITAGIGKNKKVKEIKVSWPDGHTQVLNDIPADASVMLDYKNAFPPSDAQSLKLAKIFSENSGLVPFLHQEHSYVDFNDQIAIPFKLSERGPGISVGDIDNDGSEDFFIGGSTKFPASIFTKDKKGGYASRKLYDNELSEDLGSILFDADGDGDLDLYVVSGSVEQGQDSTAYQDRLYMNDGQGNFTEAENAIPSFFISGSCVIAADFDKDGDLDLFVGGRVIPGRYPLPTGSKLLLNESKGQDQPFFIDATEQLLPDLKDFGMVTAALWTDIDNDAWPDLMVVGDGFPITVFKNEKGSFISEPIQIPVSTGYWNSITAADFDMDGDVDYVLGNLGQNSVLKATEEEPVNLYAKDIDANGKLDLLLFHYVKGKNVLFHTRDEMVDQVFLWKAYFPTYKDYALLTFDHLKSNEMLKDAYHLKYDNLNTSYLENKGNGNFVLKAMPLEAQFAPVHGILSTDFDQDGMPDLLMAGNSHAANLHMGWPNASVGNFFKGMGDGTFKNVLHRESGFYVRGNVKSVVELMDDEKINILLSRTADSLKVFEYPKNDFITLPLEAADAYAEITFKNGKQEKREFYYGSGYLSQSSRHLKISDKMLSVKIYDFLGNSREVGFPFNVAGIAP